MPILPFLRDIRDLPKLSDPSRADHDVAAWLERLGRDGTDGHAAFAAELGRDADAMAFLRAVFGNSAHLGQCLSLEPGQLLAIAERGFAAALDEIVGDTAAELCWRADRAGAMARLRSCKRRATLTIGLADIADAWDLHAVTGGLTRFAEVALGSALNHLLLARANQGRLDPASWAGEPQARCGIAVLGMGKLGARELNYSSDIDLIVLFDPARVTSPDADGPQEMLHRMVRDLVTVMSERTRDGYVFRTDLRLRPDAGATPLAISVIAAEQYYESLGQNWERAAMIKARTVAGDHGVGVDFLERLRPFVWRKYLDFAAIQDIHSIKRQINAHRGHQTIAVAGHDIKLGRGGIREIEFYAQTQQLIWGGRDPSLRERATCDALGALAAAGRASESTVSDLIASYHFLRRLEHRLQMIADEQTHRVPPAEAELRAVACFMGYAEPSDFSEVVRHHLEVVESHYAQLFEDEPELGSGEGNLVFTGTDDDPDTLATLARFGFGDGRSVAASIRAWHRGRIRATRSTRSRELLTELMPVLLQALGKTVNPDAAFRKFDEFLSNLPAGVQLFSLFYSNPGLLRNVAEVMGSAPRLAEHLSRRPNLLEGLLTGDFYLPMPDREVLGADLETDLGEARDLQDTLDIVRRWQHDREFQVGMQLLRNVIPGEAASLTLTDVADVVIAALLERVRAEFETVHGEVPGGQFAVLGMGKLGGHEMTFESDLDVIYIYRAPDGLDGPSDGAKPLPASQYYARFSQRLASALSVQTAEGRLYQIDTRLRPSGGSGPIASEIAAFERYQQSDAWTWEHMALTRARIVAGDASLRDRLSALIDAITAGPRDSAKLVSDVAEMRARIDSERHTANIWRMKHVRGGLLDLEFIAQYLQLRHAAQHPEIRATATEAAFRNLGRAGILPERDADALAQITRFMRRLQILLRLTVGTSRDPKRFSEGVREILTRATETDSFPALEQRVKELQRRVLVDFDRLITARAQGA